MSESFDDQLLRVEGMLEDQGCMWDWELSPREKTALRAVLADRERPEEELAEARERIERYENSGRV